MTWVGVVFCHINDMFVLHSHGKGAVRITAKKRRETTRITSLTGMQKSAKAEYDSNITNVYVSAWAAKPGLGMANHHYK